MSSEGLSRLLVNGQANDLPQQTETGNAGVGPPTVAAVPTNSGSAEVFPVRAGHGDILRHNHGGTGSAQSVYHPTSTVSSHTQAHMPATQPPSGLMVSKSLNDGQSALQGPSLTSSSTGSSPTKPAIGNEKAKQPPSVQGKRGEVPSLDQDLSSLDALRIDSASLDQLCDPIIQGHTAQLTKTGCRINTLETVAKAMLDEERARSMGAVASKPSETVPNPSSSPTESPNSNVSKRALDRTNSVTSAAAQSKKPRIARALPICTTKKPSASRQSSGNPGDPSTVLANATMMAAEHNMDVLPPTSQVVSEAQALSPLEGIIPEEWDILCEKGGGGNNYSGNKRYRKIVSKLKPMYAGLLERKKRVAQTELSRVVIDYVYSYGGRFLRRIEEEGGKSKDKAKGEAKSKEQAKAKDETKVPKVEMSLYTIMSTEEARRKTSQALREKKNYIWTEVNIKEDDEFVDGFLALTDDDVVNLSKVRHHKKMKAAGKKDKSSS